MVPSSHAVGLEDLGVCGPHRGSLPRKCHPLEEGAVAQGGISWCHECPMFIEVPPGQ